ncbi:hypothetical protein MW290_01965 [Aquincola tertiaricarbonis]|uniref:TonB C-terminal domain-containing protein n=1 Tax=Aquincola tertiaricarbonis TaxID=391953 RepID=A0ABY4S837_AQUTE|nr:hypothetical protein [Aquincola tertiaricarbonis]URI07409.1 hypothetical protein MW290_01965 [Aquincola tertiaricarbonis]
MHCIDTVPRGRGLGAALAALAAALLVAGCGTSVPLGRPGSGGGGIVTAPTRSPELSSQPAVARKQARDWAEYKLHAAQRLAEANPDLVYMTEVQQPLLAIPVLEIELNADGSVRHIKVARRPGQAVDTIDIAIAAVQRAAPFGDVRHLPKPWVYSEVFLFNDARKFKPRLLDE